jgi:hypothetical protein
MNNMKKFNEFIKNESDNFDQQYLDKLDDLDKSSGLVYVFYDKNEKSFWLENDTGVIKDNLSFDDVKSYMMKNEHTMYMDFIRDLNSMEDFLDFEEVMEFYHIHNDENETLEYTENNYPNIYDIVKKNL